MSSSPDPVVRRRWTRRGVVRVVALALAVVLCVVFLVPRADDIATAFGRQQPATLAAAFVLGAAATYVTFLSWRALLAGAGHRLPVRAAQRVFFLSQIGKYVPGSVWPIVAQADLGREHDVPPARSVAVGVLTLLVSCGAGVTVAAVTLPFVAPDALGRYWFVLLLVPVVLAALHPAVLRFGMRLASRVTRRELGTVALPIPTIARAFVLAAIAWVLFGLHIALVAAPLLHLGAHGTSSGGGQLDARTVLLAIGAYALAWLVGFLVFFLPAGLGGREAVLTALLVGGTALGAGPAVSIAVTSRVLLTVVDLVGAGIAIGTRRRRGGSVPVAALEHDRGA